MRIGIDARFVGPKNTGLGVYTQNLVENLQQIDKKNKYTIFLRQGNWQHLKISNRNFSKVLADVPWYSFAEQTKMPAAFKSANLDLLHVPHFNVPILYRGRFVVTIHDLIHKNFVQTSTTTRNPLIYKLKRAAFDRVLDHAVKSSAKIITPSKFVKDDIVKSFRVDSSKIVVTYEAAEKEYLTYQRSTINDEPSTLIYVGNTYPHKNLSRLLDAMAILTENLKFKIENLKLIVVCPRDVFADRLKAEIEKRRLDNKVELKGYLAPQELGKLFSRASAYIFPSLSEGFGIPPLNAMASGLPVVCSDIPTFREVYADAALYFDPNDPVDIAKKINQVLSNNKIRSKLIDSGHNQVKKYSWLKMAQQTLEVYGRA